jgi:uncharacterized heparinase superfamily protein
MNRLSQFRDIIFRSRLYNLSLRTTPKQSQRFFPRLFQGDAEMGKTIRVGHLINSIKATSSPTESNDTQPELASNVHRFQWLADLDASGLDTAPTVARELTALWIDVHGRWNNQSWASREMAQRIGFLMIHAPFLLNDSDDIFKDAFFTSLHSQMAHFRRLTSLDIVQDDGFDADKAQILYALMFDEPSRRLVGDQGRLAKRIDEEILPDGGHRSRNPGVHLISLRNLIEIRAGLLAMGHGTPVWLQTAIDRMTPMLRTFCHGDGQLCLFNGSGMVKRDTVAEVLEISAAKGRAIVNAPHSGIQRLSAGQTVVVMDTGVPDQGGQNESAGTLAFEFSSGRRRIVVNCGMPSPASASLKEICRGSAAHSALILMNRNSSEINGPVFMGNRRAHRVDHSRQEIDKNTLVEAEHDGYFPLFGLYHRRALYLSADGFDIRGEDNIRGDHLIDGVIRFHLHPDVDASLVEGGTSVLLRVGKTMGWRFKTSSSSVSLEDSVYFGDGPRRQCQQIVVPFSHVASNTTLKWRFQREK